MQGRLVGIPLWQSARIVRPTGDRSEDVICANGWCYASAMAGNRGGRRERVRSVRGGFGVRHIVGDGVVHSGPCLSVYPDEQSDARVPVDVVRFQGRLRTSARVAMTCETSSRGAIRANCPECRDYGNIRSGSRQPLARVQSALGGQTNMQLFEVEGLLQATTQRIAAEMT